MATKTISVKVSTAKVVKALETALAERKKGIADYEKAKKEYDKALAEFRDTLADLFRSGKGKCVSTNKVHNYRYNEDSNKYELTVEFPASVKAPKEPECPYTQWQVNAEIDELENAIAILKMTDEEFVSTNTYKGVARYIK